jgi:hypothetical protein
MTSIKDALERIIQIYERNIGRQNEKLADIPLVARRALATLTTPASGRDELRERIIASIRDVFGLLEMGGSNEPSYLTDAIAHFRDDDDVGPALEMISSAAESCADAILSALPVAPVVDEAGIRADAMRIQRERDAQTLFRRAAIWKDKMENEDSPCGISLYEECIDCAQVIRAGGGER